MNLPVIVSNYPDPAQIRGDRDESPDLPGWSRGISSSGDTLSAREKWEESQRREPLQEECLLASISHREAGQSPGFY
jgi:hypothetical protein